MYIKFLKRRLEMGEDGMNAHLTGPEHGGCQAKRSIQTSLSLRTCKSYVSYRAQTFINKKGLNAPVLD